MTFVLLVTFAWFEVFRLIVGAADIVDRVNRGPFLTSPLGANLDPRGEVIHQDQFFVHFPGVNSSEFSAENLPPKNVGKNGIFRGKSFENRFSKKFRGKKCTTNRPQVLSLSPGGEVIPWGWNYLLAPSILLNIRECAPSGVNEGVNIPPRGQIFVEWPSYPLILRYSSKKSILDIF
jgi:hypothetical protein